ncbi:MAG: DUF554 domain-containing protein [Bacilli bacterium]
MVATLLDCFLIIVGTILGIVFKKFIGERYNKLVMEAIGLSIIALGISQAVGSLLDKDAHPLLFIVAMVLGRIIGEVLNLDRKIKQIGYFLKSKVAGGDETFSEGFITASILFCVGTLTIVGAIKSGTEGDNSILYAKSILDGVTALFLAASFGIGVMFSSISVIVVQGGLVLISSYVADYVTDDMLREISIVGGLILIAIGIDILGIRSFKISNYLPSIAIPVIYYLIV